jgi:hypothetical protein
MRNGTPLSRYRRDAKATPDHNHGNAKPIRASEVLPLPDGVTLSRTALVCPRELSEDDWKILGRTLGKLEGSIQWWIGDWWHHGYHLYGERIAVATTKEAFGYAFQTLMNFGSVAGRVTTSRRREVLSFSHHEVIAKLTPEEQERYLDIAVSEKLSVETLRERISKDEIDRRMTRQFGDDWNADEGIRDYTHELERAARCIPARADWIPPWEDEELERYIADNLFRLRGFRCAVVGAAVFWSRMARFAMRLEALETYRHGYKSEREIWEAARAL